MHSTGLLNAAKWKSLDGRNPNDLSTELDINFHVRALMGDHDTLRYPPPSQEQRWSTWQFIREDRRWCLNWPYSIIWSPCFVLQTDMNGTCVDWTMWCYDALSSGWFDGPQDRMRFGMPCTTQDTVVKEVWGSRITVLLKVSDFNILPLRRELSIGWRQHTGPPGHPQRCVLSPFYYHYYSFAMI